jgi:hypothetical protein
MAMAVSGQRRTVMGDVRAAPAQGTGGGWQRQGWLWLEAMKAGAM